MSYLLQILLAMGSFGLADGGFVSGWRWPWAVLALCAVPYALQALASRAWRRGRFRASVRIARVLNLAPVPCSFLALTAFGWKDSLERWLDRPVTLLGWPEPTLLLALVPYVAYQLLAIDASARLDGTRRGRRSSFRSLHVRMFLSGVIPLVLYVCVAALVGASEALRVRAEEVALWNAALSGLFLVSFVILLPTILRNTWETVPMPDGVERRVLTAVAQRAAFTCREICLWRTGHMMANAAIVGLTRRDRVVLFSDSLISMLSMRELAAVFGHEMGHAVRRHVVTFLLWALGLFMTVDLVATHFVPQETWVFSVLIAATLVIWYLTFGYLSRRFELDADLYSLELLEDGDALISALEKVGSGQRDVASWRHFSTARRVAFIERAANDPSTGRRLRVRLRLASRAGLALFLAAGALELVTMVGVLDENLVYVDLRLGRYESAAGRVEGSADLPEELVALVLYAGELGASDVGSLEEAALTAFDRGDARGALRSIDLAILRGADHLRAVGRLLKLLRAEDLDRARELLHELPTGWRSRLRPLLVE